jgi:hypothetical protein
LGSLKRLYRVKRNAVSTAHSTKEGKNVMDRRYNDTPRLPERARRLGDVNKSRPESVVHPDDQTGSLVVAPRAASGAHERYPQTPERPVEPRRRQ